MVSQKSIKKGFKNLRAFMSANPDAGAKQTGRAFKRFAFETSEARISPGTLPSVITPTPEFIANKIDRKIKVKRLF